jgi:hypothetical protein
MRDIVFDYFNIITKEYEIASEKYRADPDYTAAVQKIKDDVDNEFVAKKFEELPAGLTKEKTEEIIKKKQELVNEILMKSINSKPPNAQGQVELDQRELVSEIGRFDDILYMEEGFRKEEIERAIEVYKLNEKDASEARAEEEERRAYNQMMQATMGGIRSQQQQPPAVASPAKAIAQKSEEQLAARPTGKKLILE